MTLKILELLPGDGVGPIKFGMTSSQVQEAMKEFCGSEYSHHASSSGVDYFFGSALEVDYDDDGFVEFVGTQYYSNCGCDFIYGGLDPFDICSEELFAFIAARDSSRPHVYSREEYLFPELILTLWNADEQYDYKGGEARKIYAQVGVGNQRYLKDIS